MSFKSPEVSVTVILKKAPLTCAAGKPELKPQGDNKYDPPGETRGRVNMIILVSFLKPLFCL